MLIVTDIDGILTIEHEGFSEEAYNNRTPSFENIKSLNELHDAGHEIILFSARHEEDQGVTIRWLTRHGVKFHKLILGKLPYYAIFDDRALPYVERRLEYYKQYNFYHTCWRYKFGKVFEWEVHPCFFCGNSFDLKAEVCKKCGMVICPICKKCLCKIPLLSYITLVRIHEKYCCNLDRFKGKIELSGFIDNDMVTRCRKILLNCAKLERLM